MARDCDIKDRKGLAKSSEATTEGEDDPEVGRGVHTLQLFSEIWFSVPMDLTYHKGHPREAYNSVVSRVFPRLCDITTV